MRLRNFLSLRLNDAEAAQLDSAAAKAGVTRSAYARAMLFNQELKKPAEKADKVGEVWAEMSRAQNNLEQVLRKLPDGHQVKEALETRRAYLVEAQRRASDKATVCILPAEAIAEAKAAGNRLNDIAATMNATGVQAGTAQAAFDAIQPFLRATAEAFRAVGMVK